MDIYCIFAESNLIRNYIMSLFRCPHTHKVVTSKGEVIYKECGKCRYCRMKRSVILSAGLTHASKLYKHVIFFTLTYNNENLPIAHDFFGNMANPYSDFYLDSQRFVGLNAETAVFPFLEIDPLSVYDGTDVVPPAPVRHEEANVFGVLCKRDVQLFNKRLRRLIDYDKDGLFKTLLRSGRQYKYYICGEYGPNTLRPHYHGLFFTNEDEVAQALEHYFTKAWTLCDNDKRRYDFQHVTSSAAGYVSSYVNSYVNLPRVLQAKLTRPFHIKSKHLGISEDEEKKVFEEVSNGVVERSQTVLQQDGCLRVVNTKLPIEIVNRLFPKCIGYRDINNDIGALLAVYAPISTPSSLQLSDFSRLGRDYYDAEHLNHDGSVGAYRWRNISCVRACSYVCQKFDVSVVDYIVMLVRYYCKLNMLYLREQCIEMEQFAEELPSSQVACYQHVFSEDTFTWLNDTLPRYIPLFGDDGTLCFDVFSDDPLQLSQFPEFNYYGVSPSEMLGFYDFNSVYDRYELNVGRLRSRFDFSCTDYFARQKLDIDDRFERQMLSKKINNSRYARILQKEPLG